MQTITTHDFTEGARCAVLYALDEYVRRMVGHDAALGATDAELPALFKSIDAHMGNVACRINSGFESGSASVQISRAQT